MRKYLPLLVIYGILAVCPKSFAFDVTLAWDPNSEKELIGYKVYYDDSSGDPYLGTEADQGTSPIIVLLEELGDPNIPEFKITGLIDGYQYFFAVTAISEADESGYSNEVSAEAPQADGSNRSGGGGGQGCFISTMQ